LVGVSWDVSAEGLTLRWVECGGPIVSKPPTQKGFGNTVLSATIAQQLGGGVTLDWRPDGLRATLFVPSAHLREVESNSAELVSAPSEPGAAHAPTLIGQRVLAVRTSR
jgi:hypothetical protein